MEPNALTNIAWIPTLKGNMTVRDVLCSSPGGAAGSTAKQLSTADLLLNPGFAAGSVLRILRDVAVIAARIQDKKGRSFYPDPPDTDAIDQAIELLAPFVNPLDSDHPFLQQPLIDGCPASDPLKKLSPAMSPDSAEAFWQFSFDFPEKMPLQDAVLWLAINHHYSLAGNNTYAGEKCAMGAPGIRFLGAGNAATEVFWRIDSVWHTLLMNIPRQWLHSDDLPAWTRQQPSTGTASPLWDASWSSNAPACNWENEQLVGVKTGGIPKNWYTVAQGNNKDSRKSWWDLRNTTDPFYLYTDSAKDGNLKAQRLDFGRDATDLAVTWNANGTPRELMVKKRSTIISDTAEAEVTFVRHKLEGTASSPIIRASEVLLPPEGSLWEPREELVDASETYAQSILEMRRLLVGRFGKSKNENAVVISSLGHLREDASTIFWRNINPIFTTAMVEETIEKDFKRLLQESARAAISAYDQVTEMYKDTMVAEVTVVRENLKKRLFQLVHKTLSEEEIE